MEYIVAAISAVTAIVVAVVERRTRQDDEKWQKNADDHKALVDRMDMIGSNLGRSLDRVEDSISHHIIRLENKVERHDQVLFDHLASHAESDQPATPRKRAAKRK
jgi:hypothetical protein